MTRLLGLGQVSRHTVQRLSKFTDLIVLLDCQFFPQIAVGDFTNKIKKSYKGITLYDQKDRYNEIPRRKRRGIRPKLRNKKKQLIG